MCKHILITEFNKSTDIDILKQFTDLTYDHDGFGLIARTKMNELYTFKSVSIASFYIELMRLIHDLDISELVVHHRTSTNGMGVEYSHPFEFRGNLLTHNGVISVPGKHETTTKNDSEALLHHLIKTNYETETISGYFSCFILNDITTTILVDDTAPIYSNDRIFCSHDLGNFEKITLQKIVIDQNKKPKHERVNSFPIKVTKSSYGLEKSHLSLGKYFDSHNSRDYSNQDDFTYFLSQNDELDLMSAKNKKELYQSIKEKAEKYSVKLSKDDFKDLIEYYQNEISYNETKYYY